VFVLNLFIYLCLAFILIYYYNNIIEILYTTGVETNCVQTK